LTSFLANKKRNSRAATMWGLPHRGHANKKMTPHRQLSNAEPPTTLAYSRLVL